MAVKIYDASAGAFKDAPTPQIYDASTQAYKESTGLVYDTSKGAWDERWGGVTAYVYGAALETITIKQNGVTVGKVSTDANGKSTEQIRLACGTYDLTGSVSGRTETQTVDRNTERFRAMPDSALYWYGNECIDVTGGIETYVYSSGTNKITKNINNIYFNLGSYSAAGAQYNNAIAVAKNRNSVSHFKRIYFNANNIGIVGMFF